MGRVFCIVSVKGGTGKTTTAVNLGLALTKLGEDCLVVDANLDCASIAHQLGINARNEHTIHDVISGDIPVNEAVVKHKSGMSILLGSDTFNFKDFSNTDLSKVIEGVRDYYDNIIVDCPAGLSASVQSLIKSCDEVIIVTNPELPAVAQAFKIVEFCESFWVPIKGVVVNRNDPDFSELMVRDVETILGKPVIGSIPEDLAMKESIALRDPIVSLSPKSKISRSYSELAATVAGLDRDVVFVQPSIFKRFINKLSRK